MSLRSNGAAHVYDAIVVGGGHNGLTAAAYLAKSGLRVCVLERRDILGGACVTEELWPGHRVSRASYVVSLLQPKVVEDLRLKDFGYEPHPLDPAYAAMDEDGRAIFFHNDLKPTCESIAKRSRKDAEAYPAFEELLDKMAGFLRPLMLRPPPMLGSKRPGDLLSLMREGARAAGLSKRDVHAFYRVMTMSVGDLLDDWFEDDLLKGSMASTGVVGVWAGPRTPGTAYNLLHHALGEIDGVPGLWGHVKGGMGAISMSIARSAEASGAVIRTGAEVVSIDVRDGHTTGVTLSTGEELRAPVVVSGAHPQTTVLEMTGREHFPAEVVEDLERYKTRGGSVKVNWVLSEPPRYENFSDADRALLLRSGVAFCPSIDYLERAWQDAVRGKPAASPYLEVEIPTTIDPSLTDDGATVMTMFTQYGPWDEAGWPEGEREAYGQRCLDQVARGGAERQGRGRPPRGARAAGPGADLRARRRLDLPGRAGSGPDGVHAPVAGPGAVLDAGRRPVPVRRGHASRRRRDGGRRAQRGARRCSTTGAGSGSGAAGDEARRGPWPDRIG